MKSTGIVRRIDDLGRIVLPAELRRTLDITEKDELEIFVEGSAVVLKKYRPACVFCGKDRNISLFREEYLSEMSGGVNAHFYVMDSKTP